MKSIDHLDDIIKILKKETKKYRDPSVTMVANKTSKPFYVLISCILSLRTKDETTIKAFERLLKIAKTPEQLANANLKQVEKAIYPVGFYKTKAKRIIGIAKTLLKDYKGKVPDDLDELLKLHGVGRKTGNIVLVFAYNKPALPIDTHCHRIPNRIGWVKTKTPEQTEIELGKILPKRLWKDFNNIFVIFGQNICRPIKPHCWECPITKYCKYYKGVYLKHYGKQ